MYLLEPELQCSKQTADYQLALISVVGQQWRVSIKQMWIVYMSPDMRTY